jgi:NADH dehydrogenase (ubiquinone) 1 alpha/beta subcomplex 1
LNKLLSMDEVSSELAIIIKQIKNLDNFVLDDESNFIDELNMDSLDTIQLIVLMQEKFNIKFGVKEDDIDSLQKFNRLVELVYNRIEQG